MWRELLAAVKYLLRWRMETAASALSSLADSSKDRGERLIALRTLSSLELGTLHRNKSFLAIIAALTAAFERWGITRKAATQLLYMYLAAVYTTLISAVRSRLDLYLTAAVTLVVSSTALGGVLAPMAPQSAYLMYIAFAAAVFMVPVVERQIPPLGSYDYRYALLIPIGAAVGHLLGGYKGFAVGMAVAAAPHTVMWLRRWLVYERELARVDRLAEAAAEGEPTGRSLLAKEVKEIYEHVEESGSYDLEVLARELVLFTARFFAEVRSLARERGVAMIVLLLVSIAVVKMVTAFTASLLPAKAIEAAGSEFRIIEPVDLTPIVYFTPLFAYAAGRMLDSHASAASVAAYATLAAALIV
jgi:hypothetical protein